MSRWSPPGLLSYLNKLNPAETVIVGIGNILKGDDAAGSCLCGLLKERISAKVIDAGASPENYIGTLVRLSPRALIIVDAIDFGAAAGETRMFKPQDLTQYAFSTHCLSPHLFIQAITSEINAEVILIGIQPGQVQLGHGLSRKVASAVTALADEIALALGAPH